MKKLPRALIALPALLLTALLLGACSAGSGASTADKASSGSDSGGSSATMSEDATGGQPSGDKAQSSSDAGTEPGARAASTAALSRAMISTGSVTIHDQRIARVRSEIVRLVASWQGVIGDEQTNSDRKGRIVESTMTLRVPSGRFDAAMRELGDLGDVQSESRTSEDVTTQVIDNKARIRAAERSIVSIERLLGRATQLSDVITIENDLARRQADLDSLKSQEAYLADQTSLSTINVYLSLPEAVAKKPVEARGFLAGLENGWDALRGSTVVLMTVVGAVLPFVLVLAVLGVPALWVVRRRRPTVAPPVAEA